VPINEITRKALFYTILAFCCEQFENSDIEVINKKSFFYKLTNQNYLTYFTSRRPRWQVNVSGRTFILIIGYYNVYVNLRVCVCVCDDCCCYCYGLYFEFRRIELFRHNPILICHDCVSCLRLV
jgi:hypothetical protein